MLFSEIENIENTIKELYSFDYNKENQDKTNSFKSILENIIQLELKNTFLFEKISKISFKPKSPYFREIADEVKAESWRKGVSEIQEIGLLVVSELQKNASINSQEDVEKIISQGLENKFFEFKSSLRWDLKESIINKDLEQVVIKSIASFSNANGGNLLIGVDNDGNILGLDLDCSTLEKGIGTLDDFELHLRNLLERTFGIAFTTHQLDIVFPLISFTETEAKKICHVKILKSKNPIFIDKSDKKNGTKREVFYIRSGNSSKEIEKMSEFFEYAKSQFFN